MLYESNMPHYNIDSGPLCIDLDVPMYRQTILGTCGPTSLIMVMSYIENVPYSTELEFEIWREAAFLPARLTTAIGLALAATNRGYKALVLREETTRSIIELDTDSLLHESLGGKINIEKAFKISYKLQKDKLMKTGNSREIQKKIDIQDVKTCLKLKISPIILIDPTRISKEKLSHWVVIKGIDTERNTLRVNDPRGEINEISFELFDKVTAVGKKDSQSLLIFKNIPFSEVLNSITEK